MLKKVIQASAYLHLFLIGGFLTQFASTQTSLLPLRAHTARHPGRFPPSTPPLVPIYPYRSLKFPPLSPLAIPELLALASQLPQTFVTVLDPPSGLPQPISLPSRLQ